MNVNNPILTISRVSPSCNERNRSIDNSRAAKGFRCNLGKLGHLLGPGSVLERFQYLDGENQRN